MIKVFETTEDYNIYAPNGLPSGEIGYVKDDESVHFRTNNIDGETKNYSFTQTKQVEMTQAQYDALGTKDNNTIYLITE